MNTKTINFMYKDEEGENKIEIVEYDRVCHCKLVIDTLEINKDIPYIPLNNYPHETVIKYIKFVKIYNIGKYTIDDFILGNYIGDHEYIIKILNQLTKNNISAELCELMISTDNVKKYKLSIMKCLTVYASMDDDFLSLFSKTDITKLNNYEIIDDRITFKYLIELFSGDNIFILLKNYIIFNHAIGTYIYIQLIKHGFNKCKNIIELIEFHDSQKIFCREILENYKDDNNCVNILLSHIFELKNINTNKYSNDIIKYRKINSIQKYNYYDYISSYKNNNNNKKLCYECNKLGFY